MIKRIGKKLLIYLVTLAMVLTFAPLSALAAEPEGALADPDIPVLELDQETQITSEEGAEVVFSFTPTETGRYQISSYDNENCNPYVELWDSESLLNGNDDDGEDGNFVLLENLKADKTYFFHFKAYDDAFRYNVLLTKLDYSEVQFHLNNDDAFVEREVDDEWVEFNDFSELFENGSELDNRIYAYDIYGNYEGEFLGWSENAEATAPDDEIIVREDLVLYGIWSYPCVVTYDANGGYFWGDEEDTQETANYMSGQTLGEWPDEGGEPIQSMKPKSNLPFKEFDGWYDDPAEGKGSLYDEDSVVTGPLELYAHWKTKACDPIALGEVKTVAGDEGENVWLSFTPQADGYYKFLTSDYGDYYDDYFEALYRPYEKIYDSDGTCLFEGNCSTSEEPDFFLYELKGGKTYYLEFSNEWWDAFSYKIQISKPEVVRVTCYPKNPDTNFPDAYFIDYDDQGNPYKTDSATMIFEKGALVNSYPEPQCDNPNLKIAGWSADKKATVPDEFIYASDGLKLYGIWEEWADVTFHANNEMAYFDWDYDDEGHLIKVDTEKILFRNGAAIESQYYFDFYGNPYDSYVFKGWSENPDAKAPDADIIAKPGLDLYAVWLERLTVTLDPNGGYFDNEQAVDPIEVSYVKGEQFRPITAHSKNINTSFDGWYTQKTGGTRYDAETKINENVTLYAHWKTVEPKAYPNTAVTDAASEQNKIIYSFAPSVTGTYVFNTADTRGLIPSVTLCDSNMKPLDVKETRVENENTLLICDLEQGKTYYLVLENGMPGAFVFKVKLENAATAEVTFDANHQDAYFNEGGQKPKQIKRKAVIGQEAGELGVTVPTIDNKSYEFNGWATVPNATFGSSLQSINIRENTTVYAIWKQVTEVIFHANSATAGFNGYTQKEYSNRYGRDETLNAQYVPTPQNSDTTKVFDGWATTAAATEPNVNLSTAIAGETPNVYAVWKTKGVVPTQDISLEDNVKQVNYCGTEVLFRFIPKEAGTYVLESSGNEDTCGHLYDENMQVLRYDDDGGMHGNNFQLEYKMTAGTTYYYGAFLYNETDQATFTITLTKPEIVGFTLDSNNGDHAWFDTDPGNPKTIQRSAYANTIVWAYNLPAPRTDLPNMVFGGWAETPDSKISVDSFVAENGKTLYAIWLPAGNITFDVNRKEKDVWIYNDNWEDVEQYTMKFRDGSIFTPANMYVPDFDKQDSSLAFLGWSKNKDATVPDPQWQVSGDTTVYAVWGGYVPLVYDANRGYFPETGVLIGRSFKQGELFTGYATPISYEKNKVFIGWATKPDATQPDVIEGVTPVDDLGIVYAVYAESTTVTFDANGGYFWQYGNKVPALSRDFRKGSTLDMTPHAYTEDDTKMFVGWATTADATEPNVFGDAVVDDLTTVYAVWKDVAFVTLDANGGYIWEGETTSVSNVRYVKGENLDYSRFSPVWPDGTMRFDGWYDAATGGKKVEDGTTINQNMTIYAHWTDAHPVTFDANGGYFWLEGEKVLTWVKAYAKGSTLGMTYEPDWPDNEKLFVGWATTKTAKKPDLDRNSPTDNLNTVYAVWGDPVTITYDANGGYFYGMSSSTIITGRILKGSKFKYFEEPCHLDPDKSFIGWFDSPEGGKEVTSDVTVNADLTVYAHWGKNIPVTDISMDKTATMKYGETKQLKATVTPSDATGRLTWVSSNTSVALVDSNGLVKALRPGKVLISVKAQNGKSASCELTVTKGATTISAKAKSANYTSKPIYIAAPKVTGSSGAVTVKYYRDSKYTKEEKKPTNAGKYYVKITVAEDEFYAAASKTTTLTIKKIANPMVVKAKSAALSVKSNKKATIKASKAFSFTKKAKGTVTYKKTGGNKAITIDPKSGKITVQKGLGKGKSYKVKVKVTAAGDTNYAPKAQTVTLKINVK